MVASFSTTHLVVLALVAAIQAYLLVEAWRASSGPNALQWKAVRDRCELDIDRRAGFGLLPDWGFCQGEAERSFEPSDNRIRGAASAALAVGLGGTLLAIVAHLFLERGAGGDTFDPHRLIASTGVSLFGSLMGVVTHLIIVLGFLRRADHRFESANEKLVQDLHRRSDIGSPPEGLARSLQVELRHIRDAVSHQFSEVFAQAVMGFPQVVEGLRDQVGKLAAVVEAQGEGLVPAAAELATCARAVEEAGKRLRPGAEGLTHTASLLAELPERLGEALDRQRDDWLTKIRQEQQERLDEIMAAHREALETVAERERLLVERTREILAAVSEVNIAAGKIPDLFSSQIERVAGRLGAEFGREAAHQTAALAGQVQGAYNQLAEKVAQHEKEWRNNLSVIITELLRSVEDQIRGGVGGELTETAKALKDVAEAIREASEDLRSESERWDSLQAQVLTGWKEAGDEVRQAAETLSGADGTLRGNLAALSAGSERLVQTLQDVEGLAPQMVAGMAEATTRYLDQLQPVLRSADELLQQAKQEQRRALRSQSEILRTLLARYGRRAQGSGSAP